MAKYTSGSKGYTMGMGGSTKNLGMNNPKMSKQSVPQQSKTGGMRNPKSNCAKSSY